MLLPKPILLITWALICGLLFVASAKDKPNFTGTWVREARDSYPFTAIVGPLIGPIGNLPGNNFILRVNHRGKYLQVAVEQDGQKSRPQTSVIL
jgi:hypothetical protein